MISGIILAAGESKRFTTQNKLLYELTPGISLIESIIHAFLQSQVHELIIVTGFDSTRIEEVIRKASIDFKNRVRITFNEKYKTGGMSSSVITGLKEVDKADAVLITPADIPLIPPETIDLMISYFLKKQPEIIIPTFKNRKGHPIMFKSTLFTQILMISEKQRGLKEITNKYQKEIVFLPVQNSGILKDLDTIDDLKKFSP